VLPYSSTPTYLPFGHPPFFTSLSNSGMRRAREIMRPMVNSATLLEGALGARQIPLEMLLRESDVVSLHVPLNPSTYRLMDDARLSLLKDNTMLINTSRGEVVDVDALAKHIDRLWGVALDVLPEEPPKSEKLLRLISHDKVIVTPHVGSETAEAYERLADELAANILEAVKRL
ncbi:MAG: hypothetical protein JZD41_02655, partial [Thermoproteus sp.]|nr:hypothetical protein [Thermoproteus sp.]